MKLKKITVEIHKELFSYNPMNLLRDNDERLVLWNIYGSETRCCGGHIIQRGYCCNWCNSIDPSNECLKEKVKR
jgi:hypothetical protein